MLHPLPFGLDAPRWGWSYLERCERARVEGVPYDPFDLRPGDGLLTFREAWSGELASTELYV